MLRRRGLRSGSSVARAAARRAGQPVVTVRLKVTNAGRRALRGVRGGRFELKVVVADAAGNRTTLRRTVSLRR